VKKVCLIVMDGWGINPEKDGNATRLASTPNLDRLLQEYPSTGIDTSGMSVGLPEGQMGNSEVGHLTMGSGRIVYQELTRIGKVMKEGGLDNHPEIERLSSALKSSGRALHLMGLLSDGGVHSHISHLFGLLDIFRKKGLEKIYVHAFLDGRDTPPSSGAKYMDELLSYIRKSGSKAKVASVMGRYYAMDRDNRWDRVKKAYDAITGTSGYASDPIEAIRESYERGETDEFVKPVAVTEGGAPVGLLSDGDAVVFFNFRADRAREITRAFVDEGFDGFERGVKPALSGFVCMTEYDASLGLPVLFKPQDLKNILGEVLSRNGVRQFRVSETEKYAHVTFFFNGGNETPFEGEDRLLIPSVKDVPTYDLKPEMRAIEIAEAAVDKIKEGSYSFMLMNFANGDMVGHTGIIDAAVKACETVDRAVGMVADAALERGWTVVITADHGNAEQMKDPGNGGPFTAHTTNVVPFIFADNEKKGVKLVKGGLQDVAPTVLKAMGLAQPQDMTGKPLF
jgi:2,3-bisphosphoglycerate-independent phosphoglycerate mutase